MKTKLLKLLGMKRRPMDARLLFAAQNAQQGLINTNDLSTLTGIEPSRLNSLGKKGFLQYYGEYQGKRFYNFEELMNWLYNQEEGSLEVKSEIRASIKKILDSDDCPFDLIRDGKGSQRIRVEWKVAQEAA